jgi:hypothetical protein
MPDEIIRVELDCVSGEKIVFRRSAEEGALVEVWVEGRKYYVTPKVFWLAVVMFGDGEIK